MRNDSLHLESNSPIQYGLDDLEVLAREFLKTFPKGGRFGLEGNLGAGKTTFVRALLDEFSKVNNTPLPRILSPTFVLHQSYHHINIPVDHWDLYRLDMADFNALVELGYFERIEMAPQGYHFIEWPKKIAKMSDLELEYLIHIELLGENRTLTLTKTSS